MNPNKNPLSLTRTLCRFSMIQTIWLLQLPSQSTQADQEKFIFQQKGPQNLMTPSKGSVLALRNISHFLPKSPQSLTPSKQWAPALRKFFHLPSQHQIKLGFLKARKKFDLWLKHPGCVRDNHLPRGTIEVGRNWLGRLVMRMGPGVTSRTTDVLDKGELVFKNGPQRFHYMRYGGIPARRYSETSFYTDKQQKLPISFVRLTPNFFARVLGRRGEESVVSLKRGAKTLTLQQGPYQDLFFSANDIIPDLTKVPDILKRVDILRRYEREAQWRMAAPIFKFNQQLKQKK